MLLEGETLNDGNNYGTKSKTIHYIQKRITKHIELCMIERIVIVGQSTNKLLAIKVNS